MFVLFQGSFIGVDRSKPNTPGRFEDYFCSLKFLTPGNSNTIFRSVSRQVQYKDTARKISTQLYVHKSSPDDCFCMKLQVAKLWFFACTCVDVHKPIKLSWYFLAATPYWLRLCHPSLYRHLGQCVLTVFLIEFLLGLSPSHCTDTSLGVVIFAVSFYFFDCSGFTWHSDKSNILILYT